jgi:hypothetical protein
MMKRPFEPKQANLAGPDPFGRPPRTPRVRPNPKKTIQTDQKGRADKNSRAGSSKREPVGQLAKRAAKAGAVLAVETVNRKAAEAVENLEGRVIR